MQIKDLRSKKLVVHDLINFVLTFGRFLQGCACLVPLEAMTGTNQKRKNTQHIKQAFATLVITKSFRLEDVK